MFENYLEDIDVYRRLEKYFVEAFESRVDDLGGDLGGYSFGYYNTKFGNGEPFMDGNPIFSVKNDGCGNILRVVIEDGSDLLTYDSEKDSGVERVVVGDICMLDEIMTKICEWIEEQVAD